MEIYVLNTNFESVAVVDEFESLIWTDRYDEAGDFELYMSMDKRLLEYLRKDYYLWNADSEHMMIIEGINIVSDVEEGNKLIVTGRSLESILDRRIIWGQKVVKGLLQEVIHTLLNECIISPEISERAIDNFIFVESVDPKITGLTIDTQYTGDNLYDVIQTLCKKNNIGFKIVLNDSNQFEFSLYCGEDRSYEQSDNPYVIFSPDFENIINSNYLESNKVMKNVTLVAGEGEGAARKTKTVGSHIGLTRRELFTDARDISSDIGDGQTLTDAEYYEQLEQRGTDSLSEYKEVVSFEGEVEATRMFKYGEDFFIGDIVQIANEYGHEGQACISEFVMSQSESGISMYPTFKTIQKDGEGDDI